MNVLVLEDDDLRFRLMSAAAKRLPVHVSLKRWVKAPAMIEALAQQPETCILSLDLDLGAHTNGSGFDVVTHLMKRQPCCPVIIHSSMSREAEAIVTALRNKGWNAFSTPMVQASSVRAWTSIIQRVANGTK